MMICPYCRGTNGGHYATCKGHPIYGEKGLLTPTTYDGKALIDKAELAQLRRDAERYRYIRDQDCDIGICVWDDDGLEYNDWKVLDSLHADSMIDEAMGLPAEPKRNYVGDKGICPNCSLPIYCKRCADLDDQARTILSSCTT